MGSLRRLLMSPAQAIPSTVSSSREGKYIIKHTKVKAFALPLISPGGHTSFDSLSQSKACSIFTNSTTPSHLSSDHCCSPFPHLPATQGQELPASSEFLLPSQQGKN